MAVSFTVATEFDAPVDDVFQLSLDVDFHKNSFSFSGEEIVDGVSEGGMVLGDSVTWRAKHFGFWWELTSIISAYNPPSFFVDEQTKGPFGSFRHEHHFSPIGELPNQRTSLIDVVDFEAPFGFIGTIAERVFLRWYMRRLIITRNQALVASFI